MNKIKLFALAALAVDETPIRAIAANANVFNVLIKNSLIVSFYSLNLN